MSSNGNSANTCKLLPAIHAILWKEHLYWDSCPLKSSIYCGLLEENNMDECVCKAHRKSNSWESHGDDVHSDIMLHARARADWPVIDTASMERGVHHLLHECNISELRTVCEWTCGCVLFELFPKLLRPWWDLSYTPLPNVWDTQPWFRQLLNNHSVRETSPLDTGVDRERIYTVKKTTFENNFDRER